MHSAYYLMPVALIAGIAFNFLTRAVWKKTKSNYQKLKSFEENKVAEKSRVESARSGIEGKQWNAYNLEKSISGTVNEMEKDLADRPSMKFFQKLDMEIDSI